MSPFSRKVLTLIPVKPNENTKDQDCRGATPKYCPAIGTATLLRKLNNVKHFRLMIALNYLERIGMVKQVQQGLWMRVGEEETNDS